MPDDVILAKAEIVERCLRRIDEVYAGQPENLHSDFTKQDSILLNLERACQASIDLALRLVRLRSLGLPKESREAFTLLEQNAIIPAELSQSLRAMVGFRNIAVHNYRALDLERVESILQDRIQDLRRFASLSIQL
jgi:uncharacterized protein YutE (UPF0331/DUF86 family)